MQRRASTPDNEHERILAALLVVSNKVQTAQTKRRNRRLSQINDQKRASLFGSCDSSRPSAPSGRDSPSPSVGDDSARVSGAAAAAAPPPKFRPPPSRAEAALRGEMNEAV